MIEEDLKRLPLVTISIPTLNSGSFLERCFDAIKAQTYKNVEINIVDGGSKDTTVEIAKARNVDVSIYKGALLGARYQGLQQAKGEYILLLDSDQILESTAIARAIQEIQA